MRQNSAINEYAFSLLVLMVLLPSVLHTYYFAENYAQSKLHTAHPDNAESK